MSRHELPHATFNLRCAGHKNMFLRKCSICFFFYIIKIFPFIKNDASIFVKKLYGAKCVMLKLSNEINCFWKCLWLGHFLSMIIISRWAKCISNLNVKLVYTITIYNLYAFIFVNSLTNFCYHSFVNASVQG